MTFTRIYAPILAALAATVFGATRLTARGAPDAGGHHVSRTALTDSTEAAKVAERFTAALGSGDSATAAALLDSSAVVLESGDLETRDEYLRHHLPADIAFARAVKSERKIRQVITRGDAAWIVATSRTTGRFEGRDINSAGAELMVLNHTPAGWRIGAIHWSSHRIRP